MYASHFLEIIATADRMLAANPKNTSAALYNIPTDLFGAFLWNRAMVSQYPNLYAFLPNMPSVDLQMKFTGACENELLIRTCAFLRTLEATYSRCTNKPFRDFTVLDYGFGWGRITRFFCKFTSVDRIFAVDPMPEMIDLAKASRLPAHVQHIAPVPAEITLDQQIDLVVLFSVFTHLPLWLVGHILALLRPKMSPDGVVVFTTRPIDYWSVHPHYPPECSKEKMIAEHLSAGQAFLPHPGHPIENGTSVYGDISFSDATLERALSGWRISSRDVLIHDPMHIVYAIQPS